MSNLSNQNRDCFLYMVQPGDTLSRVLAGVHGSGLSPQRNLELQKLTLANNPQLRGPNSLMSGQCIDLSPFPSDPFKRSVWRTDSTEVARLWASMPPANRELAQNQPELLSKILKWTGALIGLGAAHQDAVEKQLRYIEALLKNKNEQVIALAKARMAGIKGALGQQLTEQMALQKTESELAEALNKLTKTIQAEIRQTAGKAPSLFGSSLNKVQKNLIRIPEFARAEFNAFAPYMERVAKLGKYSGRLAKGGAYGVPLLIGAYEVKKDWDTSKRNKTLVRTTASVSLGMLAGYAGFAACTVVFFGPTGGTSPLWCGFVVGGLSGFLVSEGVERRIDSIYDALEKPTVLMESNQCLLPGR